MNRYLILAAALLASACGGKPASDGAAAGSTGVPAAAAGGSGAATPASAGAASTAAGAPAASSGAFANRAGELSNPDDSTMVFLYHDLAGVPVPVDRWIEQDSQVQYGPGDQKQARRDQLRTSITAGAQAVKGAGQLRLTMNANLSDYDPTYSEFTVQALAPSSVVTWSAFGEKVSLKFGNGLKAQTWSIPKEEAQAVRDRIQYPRSAEMTVLVRLTKVQPETDGGSITGDVVEYELRNPNGGAVIGRVKVPS
ncbi:MAG TPA: hypothetical protein VG942_06540 [Hyphomonadaceae bacterium]|nr:hypothetical protein [Hyphomonadaceae bacterium]